MKRPSQEDVARLAGVSRATVYYVLRDPDGDQTRISDSTRKRVLDAIAAVKYEPDHRAQSLRSGTTNRIGFLIPDNTNPFYWQQTVGIEQAARRVDYDVILYTSPLASVHEARSLKALLSRRVDGVIATLAFIDQTRRVLEDIKDSGLPIVLLQPNLLGVDTVSHSYGSGMNRLIAHLVALGHERIGLIYGMGEQSASMDGARLEEYEAELINAGIPVDHNLIYRCGTKIEDGIAAAEALLQHRQRPTALIAINDLLAHGAMRAAQKLGLRIPHDVSIAGFDNITFSKYSYPSLTTVTSNPKKMGIVAVRMLLDRLSDPYLPVRLVTIPSRLVIRESTGPVPDEVAK